MKKVAKVLSLALAVGCVASMAGMTTACNKDKTLKIGYTIYAPMNYTDETTGKFVGFDTEFAEKVCSELGYKAEFVEIVWETKVVSLQSKEIDCIWNGMTITPSREAEMCISVPYLYNKQVAVVLKSDAGKYSDVASMKKAIMTAESGSAGETVIVGEEE